MACSFPDLVTQESSSRCHLPAHPPHTQHFQPSIPNFCSCRDKWHCRQNDIFLICCKTDGSPSSLALPSLPRPASLRSERTGQTQYLRSGGLALCGEGKSRPRVRYDPGGLSYQPLLNILSVGAVLLIFQKYSLILTIRSSSIFIFS